MLVMMVMMAMLMLVMRNDGNDDYLKKETQTHNNRDIIQTQSNIFVDVQHN